MPELQAEAPVFAQGLQRMMDDTVDVLGLEGLDLMRVPSSAAHLLQHLGSEKEIQDHMAALIGPDGTPMTLTDDTRQYYIDGTVHHKLVSSIEKQTQAVRTGLNEVIPEAALRMFTVDEFSKLISGYGLDGMAGQERDAMVADWLANLTSRPDDDTKQAKMAAQIKGWLAELLQSTDDEVRQDLPYSKLLAFVTGASRLPSGGFRSFRTELKFNIQASPGRPLESLPVSHTCTNTLECPYYTSKEMLHLKLKIAVMESQGFGFA